MVTVITVFELVAGVLSMIAVFEILLTSSRVVAVAAVVISALSLLQLFFGQRLAKDYAGAAVLVPYFLLTLSGLFLFGLE